MLTREMHHSPPPRFSPHILRWYLVVDPFADLGFHVVEAHVVELVQAMPVQDAAVLHGRVDVFKPTAAGELFMKGGGGRREEGIEGN